MLGILMLVAAINAKGNTIENRISAMEKGLSALKSSVTQPMKKLRRQMKREIRNKLLPKMMKALNENVNRSVEVVVDREIRKMAKNNDKADHLEMNTVVRQIQTRLIVLEEENKLLKKELKTVGHTQQSLNMKCKCEAVDDRGSVDPMLSSARPMMSPADTVMSSAFDMSAVFNENTHTPDPTRHRVAGNVSKKTYEQYGLTPVQNLTADIRFDVHPPMPDFRNQDSLLIVNDDGEMTRVGFTNSSVRGSMETEGIVEGITFDPNSRKIFWGSNRHQHNAVFSVELDGSDLTKLQQGKIVFSLAVDGKRRKLFMSDWTSKVVSVMNTTGHHYKVVSKYKDDGNPRNIALDTKRRLLFVSYSFSIVKMKYDGSRIKRLAEGIWMKPLTLDVHSNMLYYTVRRNIFRLDLTGSGKKATFVNQLDGDIGGILFYMGKLFVVYQDRTAAVDVLDIKQHALTQFTRVEGDSFLRLCLIPA